MRYAFVNFEVDDQLFELRRAGSPVPIQPKALDILLYLLERRERTVPQQELLDHVWRGVKVQPNTLTQTISGLRRALGDEGESASIVQTIRTRGYRFIADVTGSKPAAGRGALVGRTAHLELLARRLNLAVSGEPSIVLIAGAPGTGKSRLLEEFASQLPSRDGLAVRVRCHDTPGAPPLWAWARVVRAVADAADTQDHPLGGTALSGELSAVEVELNRVADNSGDSGGQFRLFENITAVLRRASLAHPLVVCMDDLQLADAPSLLLLKFVVRELVPSRLLVVCAYSDASMPHVLGRTVGALAREDASRCITLEPLAPADVARIAREQLDSPLGDTEIERLHAKTGGNPALLMQLLGRFKTELGATAPLDSPTSALLADDGVREAISVQLNALSADCRALLGVAAVFGSPFDAVELAEITHTDVPTEVDLLMEAVRARILKRVSGSEHTFGFAHDLVRDVLCRQIPAAERTRLHAQAAEVLARSATDDWSRLLRVAHHYVEATPTRGLDTAVAWSLRAADAAQRAGASADALHLLERSVRAASTSVPRSHAREPLNQLMQALERLANADPSARLRATRALEQVRAVADGGD